MMRILLLAAAIGFSNGAVMAATGCTSPVAQSKSVEPLVDWYDNYIRPNRQLAADKAARHLSKPQVEAFIEELGTFNRRASIDQLEFEGLVNQLIRSYARAPDSKGIDTSAAEKI